VRRAINDRRLNRPSPRGIGRHLKRRLFRTHDSHGADKGNKKTLTKTGAATKGLSLFFGRHL
jgi:hypothetical protein